MASERDTFAGNRCSWLLVAFWCLLPASSVGRAEDSSSSPASRAADGTPSLSEFFNSPDISRAASVARHARANWLLWRRRFGEAEAEFSALIASGSADQKVYLGRARCHVELDNYSAAIADCTVVLERSPRNGEALAVRGYAYVHTDQLGRAIRDLELAAIESPGDSVTFSALAAAYLKDGKVHWAMDAYAHSAKLDPTYEHARLGNANCLLQLGESDKAVTEVAAWIARQPALRGGYDRFKQGARELTAEDLEHGRTQVQKMLQDRPEMARFVSEQDELFQWAVRKFAGEDLPQRIVWSPESPDGAEAANLAPDRGNPGVIYVRDRHGTNSHKKMGTRKSFDELWSHVVFELHNIQPDSVGDEAKNLAWQGKLTRSEYIRAIARSEYEALLRQRVFYIEFYYAWAKTRGIQTDPNDWRLLVPGSFEQWIAGYRESSEYPWKVYGEHYEQILLWRGRMKTEQRKRTRELWNLLTPASDPTRTTAGPFDIPAAEGLSR